MKLSIIIVNYNNRELLGECVASIHQNTKTEHEVIVVDNGSHDGSVEMLEKKFPDVRIIANADNVGFSKANNQGLQVAHGEYLLLLNNDTKVHTGSLDRLVSFMEENGHAGGCGPRLLNMDGTIQRQGGIMGSRFWKSGKPNSVSFLVGACLLVKREVYQKVGPLDENLFFYNEDLDWCLRIRKAGWKIYIVPDAVVTHYGGYSSRRTFNRKLFVEGFKGGLYFCFKHYGPLAFHIYRFLLVVAAPFALLFSTGEKRKAYGDIALMAFRGDIPPLSRE